jgi:hypothetical protein
MVGGEDGGHAGSWIKWNLRGKGQWTGWRRRNDAERKTHGKKVRVMRIYATNFIIRFILIGRGERGRRRRKRDEKTSRKRGKEGRERKEEEKKERRKERKKEEKKNKRRKSLKHDVYRRLRGVKAHLTIFEERNSGFTTSRTSISSDRCFQWYDLLWGAIGWTAVIECGARVRIINRRLKYWPDR